MEVTPILINHDKRRPIGVVEIVDRQIHLRFMQHVVSREMLFNIFGNAGVQILETNSDGMVRRARIVEWSVPEQESAHYCPKCEGSGRVPCLGCSGAKQPLPSCAGCGGTGWRACPEVLS
jgi:hypothetical protein